MSMFINYEYGFYPMIFTGKRVSIITDEGTLTNVDGWDPEEDFKGFLENLAVDAKWFESDDTKFRARLFEQARLELLMRIEIRRDDHDDCFEKEIDEGSDEGFSYIYLPRWRISLKDAENIGSVTLPDDSSFPIQGAKNCLQQDKLPHVNFLIGWLLGGGSLGGVGPRGAYWNDFYFGAYGISEYDDTHVGNFLFVPNPSRDCLCVQGDSFRAVNTDGDDFDLAMAGVDRYQHMPEDIRGFLGEMHPAGEIDYSV